jgi:SM-20-related protein
MTANATSLSETETQAEAIAAALAEIGWCVTDAFLPPALVASLRDEAQTLLGAGAFHRAGVGRGAALQVRGAVRGDQVLWLDAAAATPGQAAYLRAIEGLRQTLNRTLYLGLLDFEGHLAVYPPGSFYRRHLDRFRGVEARTVTCVCYLNADWSEADGGQLRLYPDQDAPEAGIDVLPLGGRLVTFLSDGLPHEVLPASRERVSITGWLKRRE